MSINTIIQHNVKSVPWPVADECVDCIVTSPPYWGLRDYGNPDQIGHEETPEKYVEVLTAVFMEAHRILKPTGTMWINIADTYWGGKGQSGAAWKGDGLNKRGQQYADKGQTRPQDKRHADIKSKDLCMIPAMLAIALRNAGYYLRQDLVWNKPNAMPESVTDRCTKSHEFIFLFSKERQYYFDGQAIRSHNANKKSVWNVNTKGYKEAHFATFPEKLIVDCVKASTSAKGNCAECGAPYKRVTQSIISTHHSGITESAYNEKSTAGRLAKLRQAARQQGKEYSADKKTIGWERTCRCETLEIKKPIVFDPFMGAGTTGLVALSQRCDFIGLELNPDYIELANKRISKEYGIFFS